MTAKDSASAVSEPVQDMSQATSDPISDTEIARAEIARTVEALEDDFGKKKYKESNVIWKDSTGKSYECKLYTDTVANEIVYLSMPANADTYISSYYAQSKLIYVNVLNIGQGQWRNDLEDKYYIQDKAPFYYERMRFYKTEQSTDTAHVCNKFVGDMPIPVVFHTTDELKQTLQLP